MKKLHGINRQKRAAWVDQKKLRGMEFQSYREYKVPKREFTHALAEVRKEYYLEQLDQLQKTAEINMGSFYRAIKSRNKTSWTSHELRINDVIIRDPNTISTAWYKHYKTLAAKTKDPLCDTTFE